MKSVSVYQGMAAVILLVFYGIYFGKMALQAQKGIRTHQIGTKKAGRRNAVELVMSAATLGVVLVQLAALILDWTRLPSAVRAAGFCIGLLGDVLFLISVCTMRDSWRAGIPAGDRTEFVSDGIYRISRNPAFLGFDLMYTGVLLLFFSPLLLAFTLFAILSLHLQILQEEQYLAGRFGEPYAAYRSQVRRYLGRKSGRTP